jgi:hypothetical protein
MLDLAGVVKASRRFFGDHDLKEWGRAIPKECDFDALDPSHLQFAEKCGFTLGFAFPPFALQMPSFDKLIEVTARRPVEGAPDSQQYGEPFLADTWSQVANGKVQQRDSDLGPREWGPYLLLFSNAPIQKAWGHTGKQIQAMFHARGWDGLTVPEYFVLQRWLCERHLDHRFHDKPEDDKPSHSVWLIDSMNDKDCSVALGSARSINVKAQSINNRDDRRAAIAGLVLPLVAAEKPKESAESES